MLYRCRRCPDHGELRKGAKTGNNEASYKKLTERINTSGILRIERKGLTRVLCPKCLEELDNWIRAFGGPHRLPPPTRGQ